MKKISLLLVLMMVVTAFFAVPFSVSADYDSNADILVYQHADGDGKLLSSTSYSAAKLGTTEVTAIQKVASDTAIHVNYTATADKNSVGAVTGTPNIIVDINSLNSTVLKQDGYTDKTYLIYQADVFLANDTASFGARIRQNTGTHTFTVAAPNGAPVASDGKTVTDVSAKASVGEWHRVQYVWNMKASSTNRYKPVVYVDGTPTYASKDTAQTYTPSFGTSAAQYGWNAFMFPTLMGATNDCWVDNITIYQSTALPTVAAKPVIFESTLEVDETEKTIGYTDANATVADITGAVTSDADSIAVYSNATLIGSDEKVANGYKLCLNKGGRIAVYTLNLKIAGLVFESNNSNVVVNAGEKTITCYPSYVNTVESFAAYFNTNADIEIYNGTTKLGSSDKPANGNTLKLIKDSEVADEYTLVFLNEITNKALYDGSKALGGIQTGSGYTAGSYSIDPAQVGYKADGDKSYHIDVQSTTEMYASSFLFKPTFYTVYGGSTSYEKIIMSYDIYPKSGSFTVGARHKNASDTSTAWIGYQIKVNGSDKYFDSTFPSGTMSLGKWYHVDYEFSHDGVGTVCKLYIDGAYKGSKTIAATTPGFSSAATFSSPMTIFAKANEHIEYYLDNLRFDYTNDVNYCPADDFADFPKLSGESGAVFNAISGVATVDSVNTLVPDGCTLRVYNADDELIESGYLGDDYTLALENAAGLINIYKVKTADPYQETKGDSLASKISAETDSFTVNNITNGVEYTSTASSGINTGGFTLPLDLNVANLGNVYTLSFDYKFNFAQGITKVDNANDYMAVVTIDGKSFFSLGGANGFCIPTTTGNSKTLCHIGSADMDISQWNLEGNKIAGMSPDTTYRVQFVVDKNNNLFYLFINEEYVAELTLDWVPYFKTATKLGTLKLVGRAGNGTDGEIWTTLSNFRVTKGMGDFNVTTNSFDISGAVATVKYTAVNTYSEDTTKTIIVAAYATDGRLIEIAKKDITRQTGMSTTDVELTFDDEASLANAASYKVFVIDTDSLRPYANVYNG